MTERTYRILLGVVLIAVLLIGWNVLLFVYIGVLFAEGVTNRRIPFLASRVSRGALLGGPDAPSARARIPFEVERALRLILAALLILSGVAFPDALWFVPWFLGFALAMAGITGVCPMAIALKKAGFRA